MAVPELARNSQCRAPWRSDPQATSPGRGRVGGVRRRSGSRARFFGPSRPSPRTPAGFAPSSRSAGRRASATRRERKLLERAGRSFVRGPLGEIAIWQWGRRPRVLLAHGWGSHAGRLTPFVARSSSARVRGRRVRRSGPWRLERPVRLAARIRRCPRPRRALVVAGRPARPLARAPRRARSRSARASACSAAVLLSAPADPAAYTRRYARWMRLPPEAAAVMCRRLEMPLRSAPGPLPAARARPGRSDADRPRPRRRAGSLSTAALARSWPGYAFCSRRAASGTTASSATRRSCSGRFGSSRRGSSAMPSWALRLAPGGAGRSGAGAPRRWWRGTLPDGLQPRALRGTLLETSPREAHLRAAGGTGNEEADSRYLGSRAGSAAWPRAAWPRPRTSSDTETTTKTDGPGPDTKTKTEWVTGTVKDYEAGKKIKIEGPGGKDYSFDLDENRATCRARSWSARRPRSATASRPTASSRSPSSPRPAPTRRRRPRRRGRTPRSADEADRTRTGCQDEDRSRRRHGQGLRARQEDQGHGPGRQGLLVRPRRGCHGVQGNVAVGERVKVTYTKTANGDKVTTIEPDHGMK